MDLSALPAVVSDGRPAILLKRVKIVSVLCLVGSVLSFLSGPSLGNILWIVLSILTYRVSRVLA